MLAAILLIVICFVVELPTWLLVLSLVVGIAVFYGSLIRFVCRFFGWCRICEEQYREIFTVLDQTPPLEEREHE